MRRRQTIRLGEALQQVLQAQKLEQPMLEQRIIDSWETLMGKTIADHTKSLNFSKKQLFLSITSAALRQELFIMREEIKNKLNDFVGIKLINSVIVR